MYPEVEHGADEPSEHIREHQRRLRHQHEQLHQAIVHARLLAHRGLVNIAPAAQIWVGRKLGEAARALEEDVRLEHLGEQDGKEQECEPADPQELVDGPLPAVCLRGEPANDRSD